MTSIFSRITRSSLAVGMSLAVVGAGIAFAGSQPTASADEPANKGQLTRRGLSGNVLANDGSSIVVETRFGNVTIGTTNAEISFPGPAPEEAEEPRVIVVGDRVGILLDRSPGTATSTTISISNFDGDDASTSTPDGGTATSTPPTVPDPSFRSVEALRITVIPSKATRTHLRGLLTEKANGRIKILRSDGTEEDIEGPPGLAGTVGDDLLFIVKRGHGGGPSSVTNTASEDEIIDRLDALTVAAEDNPELAEGLSRLRGRLNDKRLERLEALVQWNDPEDRDLVSGAIARARAKSENKGRGNSNSGDNAGPGVDSSSGGGNSGRGNSGNSGNSGGGDKGGGPKK